MKLYFAVLCLVCALVSCKRSENSDKKTRVGLTNYVRVEKRIIKLEDTLHYAYRQLMENQVDTLPINTIHLLESYYLRAFQLDKANQHTSHYLDKLQQLYIQEKKYALSLIWTDTLLTYFPNYKQKAVLLLNAGTTAELFLKDRKKMKYYYNRLLTEHPKLKKEVVEMVKFRLGKS